MMAQVSAPSCDERSEPAVPLSFVEMVTKSLPHDSAIPGYLGRMLIAGDPAGSALFQRLHDVSKTTFADMIASGSATLGHDPDVRADRKSTRLNSSHVAISYAVFCLKKKRA